MSAFKNDNTVQYGSRVLSIGTFVPGGSPSISSATSYVADNITLNRPGKTIERTNQIDEPSGQVSYVGFVTGSAQVQMATASVDTPAQGEAFLLQVLRLAGSAVDEWFYIDSVDQPLVKDGETKVPITFRKILNTAA